MPEKVFSLNNLAGINRKMNPLLVKPSELKMVLNMDSGELGAKVKRPGWYVYPSAATDNRMSTAAVLFLFCYTRPGTDGYMLGQVGTSLFKYTTGTSWGTSILTLTNANPLRGTVLEGFFVGSNGYQTTFRYDGTNFSTTWNIAGPLGTYWTTWNSRVFAAGVFTARSRVYYSKQAVPNVATFWTETGYSGDAGHFDVDPDSGGSIVGLSVLRNRVVIFKTTGAYRWDGYQVEKIPGMTYEYMYPYSITNTGDEIIGLGYNFIAAYNGIYLYPLSQKIEDIVRLSVANFEGAGAFFRDKIFLAFSSAPLSEGTYSNCLLVFDVVLKEWYLWAFPKRITAMAVDERANMTGLPSLVLGTSDGYTFSLTLGPSSNFHDAEIAGANWPINTEIVTHPLQVSTPYNYSNFKRSYFYASPASSAQVSYALDEGDFKRLGDIKTRVSKHVFPAGAIGRNIALKIEDNSTAKFTFRGIDIIREPKGER